MIYNVEVLLAMSKKLPSYQIIYFDGSSQGNAKRITTAVHLNGKNIISDDGDYPDGTGNKAEYLAAKKAIRHAVKKGCDSVLLVGDSMNVISALTNGIAPKKSKFKLDVADIIKEAAKIPNIQYFHVHRKYNLAGVGMDEHLKKLKKR